MRACTHGFSQRTEDAHSRQPSRSTPAYVPGTCKGDTNVHSCQKAGSPQAPINCGVGKSWCIQTTKHHTPQKWDSSSQVTHSAATGLGRTGNALIRVHVCGRSREHFARTKLWGQPDIHSQMNGQTRCGPAPQWTIAQP